MNPYEVLGVSENADEETIKKAYKELVKKYHPDRYVNNPLADLAAEKLKEINKAYDMICRSKSSGGSYSDQGSYSGSYNGSGSYSGAGGFQRVRMMINARRFAEAEQELSSLPHTAEWNYLMGLARLGRGMYDSGINYLRTAVNMEPNNLEYVSALNNVTQRNNMYRDWNTSYSGCGCDPCSLCTNLLCADCCCECMGGDLIPCC